MGNVVYENSPKHIFTLAMTEIAKVQIWTAISKAGSISKDPNLGHLKAQTCQLKTKRMMYRILFDN